LFVAAGSFGGVRGGDDRETWGEEIECISVDYWAGFDKTLRFVEEKEVGGREENVKQFESKVDETLFSLTVKDTFGTFIWGKKARWELWRAVSWWKITFGRQKLRHLNQTWVSKFTS
jgi:hypothetical protein